MIQTLNHYSRGPTTTAAAAASKTEEIMSRYRPIAPKPELPAANTTHDGSSSGSLGSERIRHSNPYLKSIWTNLQARPTRTRKRGRTAISPATTTTTAFKRHMMTTTAASCGGGGGGGFMGFCSPSPLVPSASKNLCLQSFGHDGACISTPTPPHVTAASTGCHPPSAPSMVTLPLLSSCPASTPPIPAAHSHRQQPPTTGLPSILPPPPPPTETNFIKAFDGEDNADRYDHKVPHSYITSDRQYNNMLTSTLIDETELKLELKISSSSSKGVTAPHPIRPVRSTIRVGCLGTLGGDPKQNPDKPKKKRAEIEEEVEAEELPAIISDSNNKVRMANSAYKELVGQPECSWLDSMMATTGKRICGEVMLHFDSDSEGGLPVSSDGFSCWVEIEWGSDGKRNKGSINAFCDVIKLACESLDYSFSWKFRTRQAAGASFPLQLQSL